MVQSTSEHDVILSAISELVRTNAEEERSKNKYRTQLVSQYKSFLDQKACALNKLTLNTQAVKGDHFGTAVNHTDRLALNNLARHADSCAYDRCSPAHARKLDRIISWLSSDPWSRYQSSRKVVWSRKLLVVLEIEGQLTCLYL